MRALDTGVLLCAVNRFVPEHARAAEVMESLASGERPWAIPVSVAYEFLELATHPHMTPRALRPEHALGFLESLLASPSARLLLPTGSHVAAMREVLDLLGPGSDLPAGFETAVLLREHDVREVLSLDRGWGRYPFVTARDPLHGPPWSPEEPPVRRYRRLAPAGGRGETAGPRPGERRSG